MLRKKCVIIDYGLGNVFSVMSTIKQIGHSPELSSDPKKIMNADRVILPGVGAYGRASEKLKIDGLDKVIIDYISTGKPLLGICVGMQLLMERGEEFGNYKGLGIISGSVQKIRLQKKLEQKFRVPVIGWFPIQQSFHNSFTNTPIRKNELNNNFYFVHSYQAKVTNPRNRIACHSFGNKKITAMIKKNNVLGVQFHPERSGKNGQIFFKNFLEKEL